MREPFVLDHDMGLRQIHVIAYHLQRRMAQYLLHINLVWFRGAWQHGYL